jgi:hypothetical protein
MSMEGVALAWIADGRICRLGMIGDDFARVRRHLSGKLADVLDERFEGKLRRVDAWAGALRSALAFASVAFVAAVLGENFLSGFGVAIGRRYAFFVLRRGGLRARNTSPIPPAPIAERIS